MKDSFDAVNKNKNKSPPPHWFDDGYNYVSFDVKSLFTNASIKKTVDIVLKRTYIDKVISKLIKKVFNEKSLVRYLHKNSLHT